MSAPTPAPTPAPSAVMTPAVDPADQLSSVPHDGMPEAHAFPSCWSCARISRPMPAGRGKNCGADRHDASRSW
jgi:hypothetical protein